LWRLYKSHKLHDYNNLIKFVATVATSNQKEQGDANKMIQEMKGATARFETELRDYLWVSNGNGT